MDILKKKMEKNIWFLINENKGLLKKYADVWDGIKNEIKTINSSKENDYGRYYMKTKLRMTCH